MAIEPGKRQLPCHRSIRLMQAKIRRGGGCQVLFESEILRERRVHNGGQCRLRDIDEDDDALTHEGARRRRGPGIWHKVALGQGSGEG